MILGLNDTPIWQRFALLGVVIVLFLSGMQTWIWGSFNSSIATLTQEIDGLTRKSHESIQRMATLAEVEQEVIDLREKVLLGQRQQPVSIGATVVSKSRRHYWETNGCSRSFLATSKVFRQYSEVGFVPRYCCEGGRPFL